MQENLAGRAFGHDGMLVIDVAIRSVLVGAGGLKDDQRYTARNHRLVLDDQWQIGAGAFPQSCTFAIDRFSRLRIKGVRTDLHRNAGIGDEVPKPLRVASRATASTADHQPRTVTEVRQRRSAQPSRAPAPCGEKQNRRALRRLLAQRATAGSIHPGVQAR